MNIKDIHTINWQMSLDKPDSIVTGMDDVRQSIEIILKTRKGEDPLRPHFGCGLFDYISKPVNTAIPNMKKEILEALSRFEPRIKVTRLLHETVKGGVKFGILYKLPNEDSDIFEITAAAGELSTGTEVNQLILQAAYEGAVRYYVNLSLDNSPALPPPPTAGFDNVADMFAWVTNYWYLYGAWHWLEGQKKLVLYVPSSVASVGNLSIQSYNNILSAQIPDLIDPDIWYVIVFKDAEGRRIEPFNGFDIQTRAGILAFVQLAYAEYGYWSIEGTKLVLKGSVLLDGYSLSVEFDTGVFAFTTNFNLGFES